MKIRFLSVAEAELNEAIIYYDEKERGLGLQFLADFRTSLERILAHPDAWMPLSPNTRRCRLRIFPYGVIYQHRKDEILIVGVSGLHREPSHWKNRI